MTLVTVTGEDRGLVEVARVLFREYEAELGVDLCFQSFEDELANLPGKYAGPMGTLLLARDGDEWLGCVAIRPMFEGVSELKRLYVRPVARKTGLGRALSEAALEFSRQQGYRAVRLDTLTRLVPAIRLYESMGFVQLEQPSEVDTLEIVYFEKSL